MKYRDVCKMNLVTVKLLVYKLYVTNFYGLLLWKGMCVRLCGVDIAYRRLSDLTRLQWACTASTRSGRVHSLPWGVATWLFPNLERTCYFTLYPVLNLWVLPYCTCSISINPSHTRLVDDVAKSGRCHLEWRLLLLSAIYRICRILVYNK